jgi:hypothetical protein
MLINQPRQNPTSCVALLARRIAVNPQHLIDRVDKRVDLAGSPPPPAAQQTPVSRYLTIAEARQALQQHR